jgi:hypothetical protein
VRVSARGTPLYNLRSTDGGWALQPKRGGPPKLVPVTPTDATHALAGHDRLGCGACHTAWVPHCPDCHTAGGPDGEQWDFGASAVAPGRWEETAERFGWGPPALGVFPDGHVDTVIPGMIWTLDASAVGGPVAAARRFAASQPHTTSRQGRACVDCHRSATALGLGTGELDVEGLAFAPAHAVDGVARDGWVGLMPDTPGEGTRVGLRSFDAAEQRRILRVGLCLPCHTGADDPRYADFSSAVKRMGQGSCTLEPPGWAR